MRVTAGGLVRLYGLVVDADLELPAGDPHLDGDVADLVIRRAGVRPIPDSVPPGRLLGELVHRDVRYHSVVQAPDGTVTGRVHGVADFVVGADLRSVRWWRDPASTDDHVALLVAASVPALVLSLAGRFVLHASAVQVDGAALAFVGISGMGKSTLAGLFCAAGAPLVTDDVLHLRPGPAPIVVGGCRELRLRPAAAVLLDLFDDAPAVRTTVDGRLAVAPTRAAAGELPLRALVVPRPDRASTDVAAHRLGVPEAAMQLVRFTRSPVAVDPDRHRRVFGAAAEVAAEVPMWVVTVPWAESFRADVASKVCESLGLALP